MWCDPIQSEIKYKKQRELRDGVRRKIIARQIRKCHHVVKLEITSSQLNGLSALWGRSFRRGRSKGRVN